MIITKRLPVSVGEMITKEYLEPLGLTQGEVAEAMGVSRRTVNELCTGKRAVTVDTALMLAKIFANTPDFWLNLSHSRFNGATHDFNLISANLTLYM
jgi:addiction module HigA family antidote